MRRIHLFVFVIGLWFMSCQGSEESLPENTLQENLIPETFVSMELSQEENEMKSIYTDFAFRYFQTSEQNTSYNNQTVVSPVSISLVLSMLANGAKDATEQEIIQTLGLESMTLSEMNDFNQRLVTELLAKDNTTTVELANSIWLNKGFTILDNYSNMLEDYYDASIMNLNFAKSSALKEINKWCSKKTNGCIPQILENLDKSHKCVLLNTLYFKGYWQKPFNPKNTRKEMFFNEDASATETSFMNLTATFDFVETESFCLAELPYGNTAYSMVVILPIEDTNLNQCLMNLNGESWRKCMLKKQKKELNLKLPKFKVSYNENINEVLQTMGINKAFSKDANFFNMTKEGIMINEARQAISFSIDEQGTEAAASSAIVTGASSSGSIEKEAINFYVNRPFLFVLKEKSTDMILFMGKVTNI